MYSVKPSTFLPAAEIQQIPAVRSLQVSQHHRLCLVFLYQQLSWSDTHGFPPEASNSLHLTSLSTDTLVVFEKHHFFLSCINLSNVDLFRCATKRVFLHAATAICFWCYLLSQEHQKGPGSERLLRRHWKTCFLVMRCLPGITSVKD